MTPGAIIIPSGSAPRFHEFEACLVKLYDTLPHESRIFRHCSPDITANLNHAVARFLADDALEWAWIVGDDHTFESNIIERLLAHQVSVVAPLVLRRSPPHETVMLDEAGASVRPQNDQTGLIPVPVVGGAGMLVRRHVFAEAIAGPYWFHNRGPERQGEDIAFCEKLREAGIPVHVDLDTFMGHLTTVAIWPARHPDTGKWVVSYRNNLNEIVL